MEHSLDLDEPAAYQPLRTRWLVRIGVSLHCRPTDRTRCRDYRLRAGVAAGHLDSLALAAGDLSKPGYPARPGTATANIAGGASRTGPAYSSGYNARVAPGGHQCPGAATAAAGGWRESSRSRLYAIWIDVLPALGVLGRISVGWNNGIAGLSADGLPQPVTLADLLLAVVIAALTMFASRNLPGLMEIAVLQRLPMDAGARYAASTVSRYLIVVTGIILGFRAIGIGWSSVQWLVAAMTVGLGFGLQEIFANFVSGIILLFERPIRVGDTVTIGDITGTVTRIQIRATTIVDWDNKELIVPNREFVTGNLVNWTLTNPTLRLILHVGIAYGSDTRLATRLLYEVAKTNSHVLEDPEPVVVFSEFGDSSLNFELRLYVNGLMNYRRLKHDLNMAIDDLFREHKIEIAFPQRDLHVRSVPTEQLSQAWNTS